MGDFDRYSRIQTPLMLGVVVSPIVLLEHKIFWKSWSCKRKNAFDVRSWLASLHEHF